MYVFVDKDVTKSQVKVNIGVDTLKVIVKGVPIIDGKLKAKINSEDSLWILDEGQIQSGKIRPVGGTMSLKEMKKLILKR